MDEYKIEWLISDITSTEATYQAEEKESNNLKELTNIEDEIIYKSIQDNVDLQYILKGNMIKENIILNEYIENYLGRNVYLKVYNYYNGDGCFSILSVEQRGDLDFAYFKEVDFINKYVDKSFKGNHIHIIDIEKKEEQIWRNHQRFVFIKNPFFWWSKKKIFRALAEVIEAQIQKTGYFYGIKISNQSNK